MNPSAPLGFLISVLLKLRQRRSVFVLVRLCCDPGDGDSTGDGDSDTDPPADGAIVIALTINGETDTIVCPSGEPYGAVTSGGELSLHTGILPSCTSRSDSFATLLNFPLADHTEMPGGAAIHESEIDSVVNRNGAITDFSFVLDSYDPTTKQVKATMTATYDNGSAQAWFDFETN